MPTDTVHSVHPRTPCGSRMSPTARTLELMRERGYYAEVVERWIPGARIRKDYAGFIDVLAIGDHEIIGIQATSASNVAARIKKITDHENLIPVRRAGIRILVHGWGKRADGKWHLREVDVS